VSSVHERLVPRTWMRYGEAGLIPRYTIRDRTTLFEAVLILHVCDVSSQVIVF